MLMDGANLSQHLFQIGPAPEEARCASSMICLVPTRASQGTRASSEAMLNGEWRWGTLPDMGHHSKELSKKGRGK